MPQQTMQDGVSVATRDRDGSERFQALRRELGVSSFGLNLIRLRPRERGRIHRHKRQEEVYLVLEGTLTLGVEGEERELPLGSLARVAPSVRRQLVNGGSEPHVGRDGEAFATWEETEPRPPQDVPLPPDVDG